ncbi:MAG: alpha-amylase family glycosyl hydrolase, partial [bacterium]
MNTADTKRSWHDEIFYHIYPLGFCGAPPENTGERQHTSARPRIRRIEDAIPHILDLGCSAVYLGPLLESSRHGYDTADYFRCDRRLGSNEDLERLVDRLHDAGLRVVLDGVFNHVGRDFHAFRDLLEHGASSDKVDWFKNINFDQSSPEGDPFSYSGWEGNFDLVELNLDNREVREHLFAAVCWMIEEIKVDGLRLDVAYSLPQEFLRELRIVADQALSRRTGRSGEAGTHDGETSRFFLLGEVIHGDYGSYVADDLLDSVTNYECYKGLWSSHNDANYHEIAHSLDRQFAAGGISENVPLYNFVDNHDVDRVASVLENVRHLFPLYGLLFTIPGMPSVYYGSELAVPGKKGDGNDAALRPPWIAIGELQDPEIGEALRDFVAELASIRTGAPELRHGAFETVHVADEQFVYLRRSRGGEAVVVVAVNASGEPATVEAGLSSLPASGEDGGGRAAGETGRA